jgi:hypothetical protein
MNSSSPPSAIGDADKEKKKSFVKLKTNIACGVARAFVIEPARRTERECGENTHRLLGARHYNNNYTFIFDSSMLPSFSFFRINFFLNFGCMALEKTGIRAQVLLRLNGTQT